ncbi:Uncharacterised protein [Nocardia farcinica]|nr:Uncharacterised protein [Nocardia farcinica]
MPHTNVNPRRIPLPGLLLRAGPGRARQVDASPGPAAGVEPAVHGQQDPQPSSSPPRPHLVLSRRHEYFDAAGRARVPPATAMPSHCPHPHQAAGDQQTAACPGAPSLGVPAPAASSGAWGRAPVAAAGCSALPEWSHGSSAWWVGVSPVGLGRLRSHERQVSRVAAGHRAATRSALDAWWSCDSPRSGRPERRPHTTPGATQARAAARARRRPRRRTTHQPPAAPTNQPPAAPGASVDRSQRTRRHHWKRRRRRRARMPTQPRRKRTDTHPTQPMSFVFSPNPHPPPLT